MSVPSTSRRTARGRGVVADIGVKMMSDGRRPIDPILARSMSCSAPTLVLERVLDALRLVEVRLHLRNRFVEPPLQLDVDGLLPHVVEIVERLLVRVDHLLHVRLIELLAC